jgi:23S rRNA (uracil1939-C5)-methyltransferase
MSTRNIRPRLQHTSEELCLAIEGIAAGGEGIGKFEGKTVFVRGTAQGEQVFCRVIEDHKTWARAELLEIIEASDSRIEPACPYYGICGGCDLQHIDYEAQLAANTAILRDSFRRIGGFSPPDPIVFPSAPWEYRNRMQFHWTTKRESCESLLSHDRARRNKKGFNTLYWFA